MHQSYITTASLLTLLFLASFFFPAYEDAAGYLCALFCLPGSENVLELSYAFIYLPFFNITNLLTIFFIVSILFFKKFSGLNFLKIIGGLLILHLWSWPAVSSLLNDKNFSDIKIGYYIWALSITGIWIIYCSSKRDSIK